MGFHILAVCTQEGGGVSLRCVLCATGGGVGGSKNQEKMRMEGPKD